MARKVAILGMSVLPPLIEAYNEWANGGMLDAFGGEDARDAG